MGSSCCVIKIIDISLIPLLFQVNWQDIAGLDYVIKEIQESVVYPIRHKHLFVGSQLYKAPKGVLLHGPPGCGKTLLAKATAKEAGMRFLNLDVAILTDKWYGESQKLAAAVFTLAVKLQPCIIFIDEIDSFLRSRNSTDHEATAMMKTQFMMLWDGLSTENDDMVIVMGATNRPRDLDKAILRRMPAQFYIGLPDEEQRRNILELILQTEACDTDVDCSNLARLTNQFSGSDLRELCRFAAVNRMRDFMKSQQAAEAAAAEGVEIPVTIEPRPITRADLTDSINKIKESKLQTGLMGGPGAALSQFDALD